MADNGRVAKLSDDEIETALSGRPGWSRDGNAIRTSYERASFPDAIAFVVRIGYLAEAADHHPDSTHDAGGITGKDFDLAQQIDAAAGR
jgi:4a-hydroxytetrahydrobiopterin dehydratase